MRQRRRIGTRLVDRGRDCEQDRRSEKDRNTPVDGGVKTWQRDSVRNAAAVRAATATKRGSCGRVSENSGVSQGVITETESESLGRAERERKGTLQILLGAGGVT